MPAAISLVLLTLGATAAVTGLVLELRAARVRRTTGEPGSLVAAALLAATSACLVGVLVAGVLARG